MERKELLLTLMIGVLLLTTAVQTVALASMSSAPIAARSTAAASPVPSTGSVGSASGATSLADLPSMVGSC